MTGRHFAQEDNSDEVGHGIATWLQSLSMATRSKRAVTRSAVHPVKHITAPMPKHHSPLVQTSNRVWSKTIVDKATDMSQQNRQADIDFGWPTLMLPPSSTTSRLFY